MREFWQRRIQVGWVILMLLVGTLVPVFFAYLYINSVARNLCAVVETSNEAYAEAPPGTLTPTGEKLRVRMAELYDNLRC